jgi:hypothetical protein
LLTTLQEYHVSSKDNAGAVASFQEPVTTRRPENLVERWRNIRPFAPVRRETLRLSLCYRFADPPESRQDWTCQSPVAYST